MGEITDKRDANVKQFMLSDGTFEAVEYQYPVHYQKDGKWVDIDNTLIDSASSQNSSSSSEVSQSSADSASSQSSATSSALTSQSSSEVSAVSQGSSSSSAPSQGNGMSSAPSQNYSTDSGVQTDDVRGGYTNKDNNVKVQFAQNMQSPSLVSVKKDQHDISWGLADEYASAKPSLKQSDLQSALGVVGIDNTKASGFNSQSAVKIRSQNEDTAAATSESTAQKHNDTFTNLKKVNSGCTYSNVYPSVELQYNLVSQKVGENIVLQSADSRKLVGGMA